MRARSRLIMEMPASGGKPCEALSRDEVAPCNTAACDNKCRDGKLGEWSAWSDCSASCIGGQQSRSRAVVEMADYCGNAAVGDTREVRFCNVHECGDDVDCEFSNWGIWSGCTQLCNGVKRRARDIGVYGRGIGKFCRGHLKEATACNTDCPDDTTDGFKQDCTLESWSEWSSCTVTCGQGQHSRTRNIAAPASNGGKDCEGITDEVAQCDTAACETTGPTDCVPGEWEDWGMCDKCGGQRVRSKDPVQEATHGGRPCSAADIRQVGVCPDGCLVVEGSCSWSDWGLWSKCTTTCGAGQRGRRRELKHVAHAEVPLMEVLPVKQTAEPMGLSEQYKVVGDKLLSDDEPESVRVQELMTAFAGGCMFITTVFLGVRLYNNRQVADVMLPMHADALG